MTVKKKMLEKCLQSIQENDPCQMEDTTSHIELECGTKIVLDVKYVKCEPKEKKLRIVSDD